MTILQATWYVLSRLFFTLVIGALIGTYLMWPLIVWQHSYAEGAIPFFTWLGINILVLAIFTKYVDLKDKEKS